MLKPSVRKDGATVAVSRDSAGGCAEKKDAKASTACDPEAGAVVAGVSGAENESEFIGAQMHRPKPVILALGSLAAGVLALTTGHTANAATAAAAGSNRLQPFAQSDAVPNPEPATLILLGSGLAALAQLVRRKSAGQHH